MLAVALEDRLLLSAAPDPLLAAVGVDAGSSFDAATARSVTTSPSTHPELPSELVFVDTGVAGYEHLVHDLFADNARRFQVFLLDTNQNGIEQISDVLAEYRQLDAVHIVSHGIANGIRLGNTWLTSETVDGYCDLFVNWHCALSDGADLRIYGCGVASTSDGQLLATTLAGLTGADVAASMNDTGAAELGGDWELEFATGNIESRNVFHQQGPSTWSSLLAIETVRDQFDSVSFSNSDGSVVWSNDWQEISEANGPAAGSVVVGNELGAQGLVIRQSSAGAWRAVDLSAATSAFLSFDYARISLDNSAEFFSVEASGDGGVSWTELDRFQGPINDVSLQYANYDISSLAAANTQIRFTSGPANDGNDTLILDNVEILFTTTHPVLVVNTTLDVVDGDTTSIATLLGTNPDGLISLREAIAAANGTVGWNLIRFNIPDSDPNHFYYRDDGTPGSLSLVAPTTLDDASITDFDPDYPFATHSWFSINLDPNAAGLSITDTLTIDGYSQPGATPNLLDVGNNASLRIELTSTGNDGDRGLTVLNGGDGSVIRGLVINDFSAAGILTDPGADGVVVQGNFLGSDITGTKDLGNGDGGVHLRSSGNLIGGPLRRDRNVIVGNESRGVITFTFGPMAAGNVVQNNYIGVDATGGRAVANKTAGIQVWNQDGMQILDNVISGNSGEGIWLRGGSTNVNAVIQGNLIGLAADGTTVVANTANGVLLQGTVSGTLLGGTTTAERNVISGNSLSGIRLEDPTTTDNRIQGNYIGLDMSGALAAGNGDAGVDIRASAHSNLVGGIAIGAGNRIAFNGSDGVRIRNAAGIGNAVLGNVIHDNVELGINLSDSGVLPNDNGDADVGENNRQNYPILTRSVTDGSNVRISGWLNSSANTTFRLEFFASATPDPTGHGEAETYIGFANVTTDASGVAVFVESFATAITPGLWISATATDPVNNTSEFSRSVTAQLEDVTLNGFWISTSADVGSPSGAPGLGAWSDGQALSFGGASLGLEPGTTTGTFTTAFNLDLLGDGDVDIDAMHYVTESITIGSGANSRILNPGDILVSTMNNEVLFGGTFSVQGRDLFLLRPLVPGEYSVGKVELILDMDSPALALPVPDPFLGLSDVTGVSLIERDTLVGGVLLQRGDFLFARDGGGLDDDIFVFRVSDVGPGVTDGTSARLLDGSLLGLNDRIVGLELIERDTKVGGTILAAGSILVTIDGDTTILDADADPANDVSVRRQDVVLLGPTQTELNGGTLVPSAKIIFEGLDVGLNTNAESLDALTLPIPQNTSPTITATSFFVAENVAAVGTVTATDPDLPVDVLTWSITGSGADDALFTINPSNGTLAFVVAPDFESPSDSDADNTYEVEVGVSDGTTTTFRTVLVAVTPLNDNVPVFLSASNPTVNENQALVLTLLATDADLPAQSINFSIAGTGADDALFTVNASHQLVFTVPPDFESPSDANGDNVYQVNVRANDGNGGVATQSISVTVLPQNDNVPVFLSVSNPTVNENQALVLTLLATDADLPSQSINFSIAGTGADDALFTVNASHQLVFIVPPDFETPSDANGDNVYQVDVRANDGNGGIATQSISVTVLPQNDNVPVFLSASNPTVNENQALVLTLLATDADLPAQSINFSIAGTGADDALFTVNASHQLVFIVPPDFESPSDANGDNVYQVDVRANDGNGGVATQSISVTVLPQNDNVPVFLSASNPTVNENQAVVHTLLATDADLPVADRSTSRSRERVRTMPCSRSMRRINWYSSSRPILRVPAMRTETTSTRSTSGPTTETAASRPSRSA